MGDPDAGAEFRALPSADLLLRSAAGRSLVERYERAVVTRLVRSLLATHREDIKKGANAPSVEQLQAEMLTEAVQWDSGLVQVINATGVILHTNLGRAPLSEAAISAMQSAAAYSNLEFQLGAGVRGSRQDNVASLICALTGAEDALVTGNNAAAMLLVLTALTRGREVIVSRGHSVEIGGGFRVPAILEQSGARLVDVGTTNRTRLTDYERAIGSDTAALLHVHRSNFRIVGFTEDVAIPELAELAHRSGIALIVDNGSGALLDTAAYGLAHEPTPIEALEAGAGVVAFSGDKLLGGPQCGIITGRRDLLAPISAHPLMRALRPDKVILAALATTLRAYLAGSAVDTIPVWHMIAQPASSVHERALHWREAATRSGIAVEIRPGESTIGGGSLPGETLPTTLVALPKRVSTAALRAATPPVIARNQGDQTLLDLRTVPPEEDELLLEVVLSLARHLH
ncbi:MAG: L-seryl-tRNA(Sec) selenium transferase [Chloroflexota bacterium]